MRQPTTTLAVAIALIMAFMAAGASAANVYYVDGNIASTGDGSDWDHAFKTIKEGIDACNTGSDGDPDLIKVAGSTSGLVYEENIRVDDYMTLEGGWDPGSDKRDHKTFVTIIDGGALHSVVCAESDQGVTIDGFTITNGSENSGGGIFCDWCSPTITNNVITGNSARYGGGIFCNSYCSPLIANNVITGNSAEEAGGAVFCDYENSPEMINNVIAQNRAENQGGAVFCHVLSSPTITNCTISENEAASGGGLHCWNSSCEPVISDCILWGDSPDEIAGQTTCVTVSHSDVEGGWAGTGNIDADPLFIGSYYLSQIAAGQDSNSPCINTGSDTAENLGLDDRTTRVDGVCDAGQIDMGYHYAEGSALHHYVDAATGDDDNHSGDCWGDAFASITRAIEDCTEGTCDDPDVIHVAEGTYVDNIELDSYITLLGGYPSGGDARDPETHVTTIDGDGVDSVMTIDNKECVTIDGFTITNGSAEKGGGIYCRDSSPTINNNNITANYASGNPASTFGAGIYCRGGSPVITKNTIIQNVAAVSTGGGIYIDFSSPAVANNFVIGNSASDGAGICCDYSSPTITNNLIAGNTATEGAGGGVFCIYYGSPTITNCTIADNNAKYEGGAVYCCDLTCAPVVLNCILWGDTPDEIAGDTAGVSINFSDVEGGWSGTGNIDDDPLFVPDDEYGEHTGYYLAHEGAQAAFSPCVDAGYGSVADYGLEGTTTCTDGREDGDDIPSSDYGPIDMGYHYPEGYNGDDDTWIRLLSFEARPRGSSIVITWETGTEIDNAGFVVYRAIDGTSDYRQLSGLIPAQGTPTSGASYSFTDSDVQPGVTFNYWLVDIDTSGKWTIRGPVSARLPMALEPIELPTANCQPFDRRE